MEIVENTLLYIIIPFFTSKNFLKEIENTLIPGNDENTDYIYLLTLYLIKTNLNTYTDNYGCYSYS